MKESGSTVSSSFGPSPNLQLISHFGSSADDAPVKKSLVIPSSLLIANRHVDVVKLLVHSCIINSYVHAFAIRKGNCEWNSVRKPTMNRCNVKKTFGQIMTFWTNSYSVIETLDSSSIILRVHSKRSV